MLARPVLLILVAIGVVDAQAPAPGQVTPTTAPAEPTFSVLGATGTDIKIQVVGPTIDQILLIQAPDKPTDKQGKETPPDKVEVEVQVSRLVGTQPRWVDTTAKWVECATGDKVCNKTTFEWQARKKLRLLVYGLRVQSYGGTLDLIYSGKRHSFKLTVERVQEDLPVLRQSDFKTERSDFVGETNLQAKKDGLYGVTVEATPLISKSVAPVPVTLEIDGKDPHRFGLAPFGQVRLKISARLPVADEYKGGIDVLYGGQRVPLAITVTRADTAAPLKFRINGVAREETDAGYIFDSKVALLFDIEGLRSEPLTLNLPRIVELARKESGTVVSQAHIEKRWVEECDPGDSCKEIVGSTTLDGRRPRSYRIVIEGLHRGEYSGTLMIANNDLTALERTIGITVRRSWLVATFFIAMGVSGSLLLRLFAQRTKPKLQAQIDISKVNDDLKSTNQEIGSDLAPAEGLVIVFLGEQLDKLSAEWAEKNVADGDARLKELAAKVAAIPKWVTVRRTLDSTELPRNQKSDLGMDIAKVEELFKQDTSANVSARIDALSKAISDALKALIKARVDSLTNELPKQEQSGVGKVLKQQLDTEVTARLTKASDPTTDPREAARTISDANLILHNVLARGLESKLRFLPLPVGLTGDEWQSALAGVTTAFAPVHETKDPDVAAKAYQDGFRILMEALLLGIRRRLADDDTRIKTIADNASRIDAQNKSAAAAEMAQNCEVLVDSGDTAGAQGVFESLSTAVQVLDGAIDAAIAAAKAGQPAPAQAAARESIEEPIEADTTVKGSLVRELRVVNGAPERSIRDASELAKKLRKGEFTVAAVGFIIAMVVGLRMFWTTNATWGSLDDILVAMLWGLGVHQTTAVFLGQFDFSVLLARITGTKTPA